MQRTCFNALTNKCKIKFATFYFLKQPLTVYQKEGLVAVGQGVSEGLVAVGQGVSEDLVAVGQGVSEGLVAVGQGVSEGLGMIGLGSVAVGAAAVSIYYLKDIINIEVVTAS